MNENQKVSRERIVNRYGQEPDGEYNWGEIHFLVYNGMHIGIELDGYAHS